MADKPPYALKYNLEAWNVDRMHTALARLREIAGEYELASAFKVTIKIESGDDNNLRAIYEQFEAWLQSPDGGGVDGRALLDMPVARPRKPQPAATPMDELWSGGDDDGDAGRVLIPPVVRLLAAPDPDTIIEATEVTIEEG